VATVGVKELKNRLTHYLRRVRAGEEVVVTDRSVPVALIQAVRADMKAGGRDARLARLAAGHAVTLPSRPVLRRVRRVTIPGESLAQAVLDDRR
jgi:prevent-host-death family protein